MVFDPTDVPRFPLVRISMAVAVITVASPYLARPTRRVGQSIVLLLALATMYLGRSLPADVVGALVLGWGVAALVHFVFGTAARRPTADQVMRALAALDVPCDGVRAADDQPVARAVFFADGAEGPLRIIAIGRDEADAQLMARIWRWIAYRDAPPTLFPTRRQQVEYEAYTMLLAREAGARVPHLVVAGTSNSLALLVAEDVRGEPLGPGSLEDAWYQVRILHTTHIAHGRLDAEHVLASNGSVTIVGWERASTGASEGRLSADVAHLLAATAAIVGTNRAVAAAIDGVGSDRITAALPLLQPGRSRTSPSPRSTARSPTTPSPSSVSAPPPPSAPNLPSCTSCSGSIPGSSLMAVGALVAIAVLLSRVGDPVKFWDSIRDAQWAYVALAFGLGMLTDVAFAVAFLGTVPVRIPLWPSIELQSSMSFSNLAVPIAADTAIQIRFLQKFGLDLSSAVATGGIFSYGLGDPRAGHAVLHRALALTRLDQLREDRHEPDRGRRTHRDLPHRCGRGRGVQRSAHPARGRTTGRAGGPDRVGAR